MGKKRGTRKKMVVERGRSCAGEECGLYHQRRSPLILADRPPEQLFGAE